MSIVLEALTRFLDPPEIGNPELILAVGCLGLASNLVGFGVLGGHGHSHGPGGHGHGEEGHSHDDGHSHGHGLDSAAEEGRAGPFGAQDTAADEGGHVADLLPEVAVAKYNTSATGSPTRHIRFGTEGPEAAERSGSRSSGWKERRTPGAVRHGRLTSIEDISIHPASFRQEIIDACRSRPDDESSSDSSPEDDTAVVDESDPRENTPLLKKDGAGPTSSGAHELHSGSKRPRRGSGIHHLHNHNKPKEPGKSHGHSHGDMGMNAMILHVLGDALGNVGVIITALIIWLTDWEGRYYADPAVSLFITLIILRSAVPLTLAASKILLQATPEHIDLKDVKEDIQALPGVISCHHVHIWQLSDTKVVASMHIQVAFPISEANGEKYMELSKMARKCLHAYGIHSATIQPEFCLDSAHDHGERAASAAGSDAAAATVGCGNNEGSQCLLDCVDDCVGQGCCSPPLSRPESSHSAEDGHDHGDHTH